MKKWNSQTITTFLEAYEQCTCLWDLHSQDYRNKQFRDVAYETMAAIMNIEGFGIPEVKAKIRSIRNAYTIELTKIAKSKKSGGADEIYKPTVPWFPVADRFLRQVVQLKDTNLADIKNEILETQSTSEDQIDDSNDFGSSELYTRVKHVTPSSRVSSRSTPKRMRMSRKEHSSSDRVPEHFKERTRSNNDAEDEFDYFSKSVACQLKKLPEPVALESMAYIQSYLAQQKLKTSYNPETVFSEESRSYSPASNCD